MDQLHEIRKLHKIRINLKSVAEILSIINAIKPNNWLKRFLKNVSASYKQIGKWHDYEVLSFSLKNFACKKGHGKKVIAYVLDLVKSIENKQEVTVNKIQKALKKNITEQKLKHIENLILPVPQSVNMN